VINVLLDDSIPTNLKDTLGWVIMATAAFNILVNLSIVIVNSIIDIFRDFKHKAMRKAVDQAVVSKIKNRRYFSEKWKGTFSSFDSEMKHYEAI